MTDESKEGIYQDYRRGQSVGDLAERFGRTRTSIYRIINETRARRLLELPLDHIYNEDFDRPDAEQEILGPLPSGGDGGEEATRSDGLAFVLGSLYEVPLLTREQEQHLSSGSTTS